MINWHERYKESQMIQQNDHNVSTERIRRLVNIYRNDLIEEDLHQYAQRLSNAVRCCQSCTPKSYTNYKWLDTFICSYKNLFDFNRSGRVVSSFHYYWHKTVSDFPDQRGQVSDFQIDDQNEIFTTNCLPSLARNNDNILIKKSSIPSFIHRWIRRFQMYYTYRKARQVCDTLNTHIQTLKTFRVLFQRQIPTIFICFAKDDQHFRTLFWSFRHLMTVCNWPWTTKIFSNRSFDTGSIIEQMMIKHLGLVDLSTLNMHRMDLYRFLYRCLKTSPQNGPIIFLFQSSSIVKSASSDDNLMSFLIDLIQFDLSIPDLLIIPTSLFQSTLSFCQPFSFKELIESLFKKFNIEQMKSTALQPLIKAIFLHLAYDIQQLESPTMTKDHLLAAIELCQLSMDDVYLTSIDLFNVFEKFYQTCSFIKTDNQLWTQMTINDVNNYFLSYDSNRTTSHLRSKYDIVAQLRQKYFLESLVALSILSKIQPGETISRILESDWFNQLEFLLITFLSEESFVIRSCENLQQVIQQIVQLSQRRGYLITDNDCQKSMIYRDAILSDHEWSEDEDNGIDLTDDDFDDDDIELTDRFDQSMSSMVQPSFRINNRENLDQMKFFAKLLAGYLEAMIHILNYHITNNLPRFTLPCCDNNQIFRCRETSSLITGSCLDTVQRAYSYRISMQLGLFNDLSMSNSPCVTNISPLNMDDLCSVRDDFAHLLNCCF